MYKIVKTKHNVSRTEKMLNDLEKQGLRVICSIERGKFLVLHKEDPKEPPKEEPKKEEVKIEQPTIEPPKEKLNITIPLEI